MCELLSADCISASVAMHVSALAACSLKLCLLQIHCSMSRYITAPAGIKPAAAPQDQHIPATTHAYLHIWHSLIH